MTSGPEEQGETHSVRSAAATEARWRAFARRAGHVLELLTMHISIGLMIGPTVTVLAIAVPVWRGAFEMFRSGGCDGGTCVLAYIFAPLAAVFVYLLAALVAALGVVAISPAVYLMYSRLPEKQRPAAYALYLLPSALIAFEAWVR